MFAEILRRSISLVMLPIYTRYLTLKDYGVIELLTMIIDVSTIIFGARATQAIYWFYCTADTLKDSFVSRIHGPVQAQVIFQVHDIKPIPVYLET